MGDLLVGALVEDTVVPYLVTYVIGLTGVGTMGIAAGIDQHSWGLRGVDGKCYYI